MVPLSLSTVFGFGTGPANHLSLLECYGERERQYNNVHIHRMNPNGTPGECVYKGLWTGRLDHRHNVSRDQRHVLRPGCI